MSDDRKETKREDEILISRFLGGDTSAFDALVRKYRDRVIHIAYRVVQDQDEAVDVSQEVFVKVFRSLNRFSGKSSFYTWLYRIATNLAIDHRRRSKRILEFRDELKTDDDESETQLVAKVFDPRDKAIDEQLEKHIHEEINELPEHHRMVVLLRDVEDYSYAEIAEILGCSIGTVMSRLHYAREKLQKKLQKYL
ncbi:MAG TPA: sigma-70 family RNA polymerase sigma factor [bacterium]|nr:sigma-70 family RNA polymerase sigma factor [bacterium]